MANIQQLLNDEIRRLARKEVILIEKEFKAQLVELRKSVSELTKKEKMLEKQAAKSAAAEEAAAEECAEVVDDAAAKTVRVTPERITKWRTQLGLKRAQYAKLLGVSPLSVTHWENGSSTPREKQKINIAKLRDMGKRELKAYCQEKGVVLGKSKQQAE